MSTESRRNPRKCNQAYSSNGKSDEKVNKQADEKVHKVEKTKKRNKKRDFPSLYSKRLNSDFVEYDDPEYLKAVEKEALYEDKEEFEDLDEDVDEESKDPDIEGLEKELDNYINYDDVNDEINDGYDFLPETLKFQDKENELKYKALQKEILDEIPTAEKIITSSITKKDQKECLKLLERREAATPFSKEFFDVNNEINFLLSKNSNNIEEIEFLEAEESKLKKLKSEDNSLKNKILKLKASDEVKAFLLAQYEEMLTYPTESSQYSSLYDEITWAVKLPYEKKEEDDYLHINDKDLAKFYKNLKTGLDQELFGMKHVKERLIHILNDRRSSQDSAGRNLCLLGDPATGKTAICKALAKVWNKKFAKISAATLDAPAIKGSNKVWIGSEPSVVLQILADLGTNDALILFDEIDKVDIKCQHALLHLADMADNHQFQDNFLKNFPHDLSKVLFVFTANNLDHIDSALKDRFDIIDVPNYTVTEKIEIFQKYMLPKSLLKLGMKKDDVSIGDNVIKTLIESKELTLRGLEKICKNLVSKVNMYKVLGNGVNELNLSYNIPRFNLPIKIDNKLFFQLIAQ